MRRDSDSRNGTRSKVKATSPSLRRGAKQGRRIAIHSVSWVCAANVSLCVTPEQSQRYYVALEEVTVRHRDSDSDSRNSARSEVEHGGHIAIRLSWVLCSE